MEIVSAMSAACLREAATCRVVQKMRRNALLHGRTDACRLCGKLQGRTMHDSRVSDEEPSHCENAQRENRSATTMFPCRCERRSDSISRCTRPSFFKIVFLLLTLNIAPTEGFPSRNRVASPVLRSLFATSIHHPAVDGTTSGVLRRLTRSVNLHRRSYRTRTHVPHHHEARTCEDFVANLSHMNNYAYRVMSDTFKRPRKREAADRVNADRTWGEVCSHAYSDYMAMKCYTDREHRLFGSNTMEVKAALKTIVTLVQQEMNRINYRYQPITTCRNNPYVSMGQHVASRSMVSHMFTLNGLIKQKCLSNPLATERLSFK